MKKTTAQKFTEFSPNLVKEESIGELPPSSYKKCLAEIDALKEEMNGFEWKSKIPDEYELVIEILPDSGAIYEG